MSQFDFQKKYTFEQRQGEADRILRKYPDRIPVIVEKSKVSSGSIPDIDKHKYLVPMDLTVGQFVYIIRKRLILPSEQAIFIFINNSLPPTTAVMSDLYRQYKELDNFLYCAISGEQVYGSVLRDLGNA